MVQIKQLEIEIREMDFNGIPAHEIANRVGLSTYQVLDILEADFEFRTDLDYAENAADLDADFYGRM
jgi:hypothetical protein